LRILLADAQHLTREGIRLVLEAEMDMEVVAAVGDGQSAVDEARRLEPDIALLDVLLPTVSGLTAVERITSLTRTRCLILSARHSCSLVNQALRAGAAGYVLKSSTPRQLHDAIQAVGAGQYYLSPPVASHVVNAATRPGDSVESGLGALTSREREVVKLIGEGYSTKEIASELGISQRTADGHRAHIMSKLSIHKLSGLVRFAIREGLVEL